MNKTELVEKVAVKCELTKKCAGEVVEAVFGEIAKELKGGKDVKVAGFGNFVVKTTKARTGVNPATKETIKIPAGKKVSFHAAEALKAAVK